MKRSFLRILMFSVVLLTGQQAHAQTIRLGIGAGVVSTQSFDNTLFLTANLRLGSRGLVLEPEVGYWKKTVTTLGLETSAEDLSFGGNALIVVPVSSLEVFGGAGLGAHRLKGTFGLPGLVLASDSETKLGIHLLGGLDFRLSPVVNLFGAARYDIVHQDNSNNNIHETKFYGGLRFHLQGGEDAAA